METLNLREHEGLPTWVWDQPTYMLAEGHICYSEQLEDHLSDWPHHSVGTPGSSSPKGGNGYEEMSLPVRGRTTLSSTQKPPSKKGGGK